MSGRSQYSSLRMTEITPFYRAFISFLSKKDLVKEIERRKRLQDTQQMFDPKSTFSQIVRKLCFVACCYNLLTVPFRAAFLLPSHPAWYVCDALTDIPPLLRIISCFMSPYEEEGRRDIVRNRVSIVKKYFTGQFLLDFVSQLPVDYVLGNVWWRMNRLLQWKRLEYLQKDWETTTGLNPMTYRMGKVVCIVLIPIIHIVACFWYVVARKFSDGTESVTPLPFEYLKFGENRVCAPSVFASTPQHHSQTLDEIKLIEAATMDSLYIGLSQDTDVYRKAFHNYFASLYFSIVYLVGYNAGVPRNGMQGLFCLVVVFLGAGVFALIIGYVGMILRELDNTQQIFRDQVDNMLGFMQYGQLPKSTVKNVLHFYKHMWESRRGLENLQVMKGLPSSLHRELLAYLHKDFVMKVPLFKGCDDLFLEDISCCLQYVAVLPTYYVLRKGEVGKEMFFIHKGQVDVVSEKDADGAVKIFASLSEGSFFGEVALVVPGAKRTASIVSKTFTELFVLNKTDFESLLDSYPETRAKILQVAVERGTIEKPGTPPGSKDPPASEEQRSGGEQGDAAEGSDNDTSPQEGEGGPQTDVNSVGDSGPAHSAEGVDESGPGSPANSQ